MREIKVKVLIYSEIDWSFLEQRHHYVARFFISRGFDVIFYQRVAGRMPGLYEIFQLVYSYFKAKLFRKKSTAALDLAEKNIILRRSYFLPQINWLFKIYNKLYWRIFHMQIQEGAIIYSFSNNPAVHGFGQSGKRYAIFDIIHNWWYFPWHTKAHAKAIESTLPFYDQVVTDSPKVQQFLSSRKLSSDLMLPGVGEHWLATFDVSNQPRPSPCFFGNLRLNSDLELMEFFNSRFGVKVFGRIDRSVGDLAGKFSQISELDNGSLPKALSEFNIILLPYKADQFSKTISPAKYFEALATGSLIVTRSDFSHLPGGSEFVLRWHTDWSAERFLRELSVRLQGQEKIRELQRSLAREHIWDRRLSSCFEKLTLFAGK